MAAPGSGLVAVGCPTGPAVLDQLLPALAAALDGSGPAIVPVPDGQPGRAVLAMAAPDEPLEPVGSGWVALIVPTSGSTGQPRGALLTNTALMASAAATHRRLGGTGSWLLCLPTTHIAGLQVLARSLAAGTTPVCQELAGGFTADGFVAAAGSLPIATRRYTSLVPTQLDRLLADPAATDALSGFDAVLLGGAAAPATLVERAGSAGVRTVLTYGMSETCGGCVYDGVPLDGVGVDVGESGRIRLSGAVLFSGYRRDPDATAAVLHEGVLTTTDLGNFDTAGALTVRGRADSVIRTGGESINPEQVERVLTEVNGVHDAVVVGLPDEQWGQRVVALVVAPDGLDRDRVRALVAQRLGRAAVPRQILEVDQLPRLGIGKPDRAAARELAGRL